MHAYDSACNYVLFRTGSPEPTRLWSRAQGCSPTDHERLKFVVLKTPPATAKPVTRGYVSSSANVVQIDTTLYKVDHRIFPFLKKRRFLSCHELREAIREIRKRLSIEVDLTRPLNLRQPQRAFSATNFNPTTIRENNSFPYPYKFLQYTDTSGALTAALDLYFPSANVNTNEAFYFSVITNDKLKYTPVVQDLYHTASIFGKHMVARTSFLKYEDENIVSFDPIYVILSPPTIINNKNISNVCGVLFPLDPSNIPESKVVFVPIFVFFTIYTLPTANTFCKILMSTTSEQEFENALLRFL
jgi:hypothetical protein